jgi:hypothetical protein
MELEPTNKEDKPRDYMSVKRFSIMVEERARRDQSEYLDAVLSICTEFNYEPQDISRFINGSLRSKLMEEALNLNLLKNTKRGNILPL